MILLLPSSDDNSKCPLDIGAILGRIDMLKELLSRGADVNSVPEKGKCNMPSRCYNVAYNDVGFKTVSMVSLS